FNFEPPPPNAEIRTARPPGSSATPGSPGAASGTAPATSPGGAAPMTVTQVSALVRGILTEHAPTRIAVVGQISNLSARSHWFVSVRADGASLRCVCCASVARRVHFNPADGMEVVATGRLDYYDATGQLQFYVDRIEPVGLGELER